MVTIDPYIIEIQSQQEYKTLFSIFFHKQFLQRETDSRIQINSEPVLKTKERLDAANP